MLGLGPTELIIILVIIVIVFGVGRISKIGGELGSGIKAFKEGLGGDEEKEAEAEAEAETETETEEK
jgi:sec-independent protein translocase protein TatA